jgi:predicted ATPase
LSTDQRRLLAQLLADDRIPNDLESKASRDALWLAMTDLVLRVLSDESLVLVMEDLQWADSESIAWLDHLIGRSARHPLVLLACVRPHFWQDEPSRFAQRSHTRIDLRPISHKAVRTIAEAML